MEKVLKIPTTDRHIIYGTLNTDRKSSNRLIIFVHGLTGHQNEHTYFNAARLFPKNGFATFRFDLYSGEKKARSLTNSTIHTHVRDLETILGYFADKYRHIFLVGHSYGGLTILLAEISKAAGIVMWDSSYRSQKKNSEDLGKYHRALGAYLVNWGPEFVISKKFVAAEKNLPEPEELVRKIKCPIKFVVAGKSELVKAGKNYFQAANQPKELVVIPKADHNFNQWGTEKELFRETLKFVKKYS